MFLFLHAENWWLLWGMCRRKCWIHTRENTKMTGKTRLQPQLCWIFCTYLAENTGHLHGCWGKRSKQKYILWAYCRVFNVRPGGRSEIEMIKWWIALVMPNQMHVFINICLYYTQQTMELAVTKCNNTAPYCIFFLIQQWRRNLKRKCS